MQIKPKPDIKIPPLPLSNIDNQIGFSSARVTPTQPYIPPIYHNPKIEVKRIKSSNKSELFLFDKKKSIENQKISLSNKKFEGKKKFRGKNKSLPQKNINILEGRMQPIDELSPTNFERKNNIYEKNNPQLRRNNYKAHHKMSHGSNIFSNFCFDYEDLHYELIKMKNIKKRTKSVGVKIEGKNDIEIIVFNLIELRKQLKTLPKLNEQEKTSHIRYISNLDINKKDSNFNESSSNHIINDFPPHISESYHRTSDDHEDFKNIYIEDLNHDEDSSYEYEQNNYKYYSEQIQENILKYKSEPLEKKHLSYMNKIKSYDIEKKNNVEMKNIGTDTDDLINNAKFVSFELAIKKTSQIIEEPNKNEVKIINKTASPHLIRHNTVNLMFGLLSIKFVFIYLG